ncbi:cyclic GMP-AMP synthase-like [Scleropages formosus]|uniref:Cyclic GMP-AMP synthase-like n=1 Tax=Scleropages formosus TaxID=113540 RepID=A0A0P7TUR1_SCLFO|nr:cyclic GMP-AMP synthase-like [Scleropages formosus]
MRLLPVRLELDDRVESLLEKFPCAVGHGVETGHLRLCRSARSSQNTSDGPKDPPAEEEQTDPSISYRWIRERAQRLILRRTDQRWASELVNHLREKFLSYLKQESTQPYYQSVSVLNSGSYYEMVKINNPNEFDMMVVFPTPRLTWVELPEYHGLHYSVCLARSTHSDIRIFLLDDGLTISASKVLEETRRLVRKFLSTYKDRKGHWRLTRKSPNSPAITLVLKGVQEDNGEGEGEEEVALVKETTEEGQEEKELISLDIVPALEVPSAQRWPVAAREGLDVKRWLGRKARQALTSRSFFFVPKKPAGRNLTPTAKESWRISFSHIEKEIIKNHGQNRTCCEKNADNKQCFKLLKFLIEALKQRFPQELEPLCSYHGKTAFLHMLSSRVSDAQWAPRLLPRCFMLLLEAFESHVRDALLPHFFVPTCNLFAAPAFPPRVLAFLRGVLEEQRKLGVPLLQVVQPEPLLSPCCTPTLSPPANSPTPAMCSMALPFIMTVAVIALSCSVLYLSSEF